MHASPVEFPAWLLAVASGALDWNFGLGRMELAGAALLAVAVAAVQWAWNRVWQVLDDALAHRIGGVLVELPKPPVSGQSRWPAGAVSWARREAREDTVKQAIMLACGRGRNAALAEARAQ